MRLKVILPALVALALALAPAIAADGNRAVVPWDSPILDDLRFAQVDAGLAPLPECAPMPAAEALAILAAIDRDALSEAGRAAYDRAKAALEAMTAPRGEGFSLGVGLEAALAAWWRSEDSLPWAVAWNGRPPLAILVVEPSLGSWFGGRFEADLGLDPFVLDRADVALPVPVFVNVPLDASYFDLTFPHRAYVELGGEWWSFQLGRDTVDFGEGRTGNLALSSNAGYLDFFRLAFWSEGLRYSSYAIQLGANRYLYGHRLDARLAPWLSLSLQEGTLDGRNAFQLRFLNPLMLFHNFFAWVDPSSPIDGTAVSSMALLELVIVPTRGLEIDLQAVMTQFQTPYEIEHYPDAAGKIPNGLGFLCGIRWFSGLGESRLELWAEGVYTMPYLYLHDNPETRFVASSFVPTLYPIGTAPDRHWWKRWLGYRYGPDTMAAALGAEWTGGDLRAALSALLLVSGEVGMDSPWPDSYEEAQVSTPSGEVDGLFRIDGSISWSPLPSLSLGLSAGLAFGWGASGEAAGVEFGASVSWAP